jgi:hypothetical protein
MRVIHFTQGATDPLWNAASGARYVPLADRFGATHVSCLHLEPRARILEAPAGAATALLLVHGYGALWTHYPEEGRIDISPGMGFVFEAGSRYSLQSRTGMIYLLVEATALEATAAGVSTPDRIRGQRWPGETIADLRPPRSLLGRCLGDLEWPVRRLARRAIWRLSPARGRPIQPPEWESLSPSWRVSGATARAQDDGRARVDVSKGPGDLPR